jgi:ribonuclease PH
MLSLKTYIQRRINMRPNGRANDELREIKITTDFISHAPGSVLIEFGKTRVICTATVEDKVPPFLKGTGRGWVTGEYAMIPASTQTRKARESSRGKIEGRTQEIQRLIGRALRSVVDLDGLGERTIWIDCDVIQADGGTRTASITGSFVALVYCINWMIEEGMIEKSPIRNYVAAVSVGINDEVPVLDLCYEEDSQAKVDMNIVMTDKGEFIEVQGTGEESPFSSEELFELIKLGQAGIKEIIEMQKEALGHSLSQLIGEAQCNE